MSKNGVARALMVLALAGVVPSALAAQEAQLPPEAQALLIEIRQIQTDLGPVREQAMADPELQQAQQALTESLRQTMLEVDPAVPAHVQRLNELQALAQEARAAQDQQAMAALVGEGQELEQKLFDAQQEAMNTLQVAAEIERFQARLEQRMLELDPEVAPLLQRFREIDAELEALLPALTGG